MSYAVVQHPLFWAWTAVFALAIGLTRSRWGQNRPMALCAVLSLIAHVMLAVSACSVDFGSGGSPASPHEERIRIARVDLPESSAESPDLDADAALRELFESFAQPAENAANLPSAEPAEALPQPTDLPSLESPAVAELAAAPSPELPLPQLPSPLPVPAIPAPLAPLPRPDLARRLGPDVPEPIAVAAPELPAALPSPPPVAVPGPTLKPLAPRLPRYTAAEMPEIYRLRFHPARALLARRNGSSPEAEAAVEEGLAWLAAAQDATGGWNAHRHGAGQGADSHGQVREQAGRRADHGVSALALLAFLGAGHTPREGKFAANVERGTEFLIRGQDASGHLAGPAALYEFMYCHGMATFALAECWAITRDPRFAEPVRRAIDYTLRAQDRQGGGWRYQPGDAGDMSVFGWQLMALESAERAGLPLAEERRALLRRFVESVGGGNYGGTASYRPGEPPTPAMTAEALFSRQLLGISQSQGAREEAVDLILSELPGLRTDNDYCWYYATLALHREGGATWDRWDEALQRTLLRSRERDGSWPPRGVWGGHGGRVYSTAIAVLCLEIHYRYQDAPQPGPTVRRTLPGGEPNLR